MGRGLLLHSIKYRHRRFILLIAIYLLSFTALLAAQLLYQPTGNGKLSGFDIERYILTYGHNVSNWHNKSAEAWNFDGSRFYVGRLLFLGEPGTTLTVTNLGPLPTSGSGYNTNKFYWTQMGTGATDWSEVFIVLRPKGFTHKEQQVDYLKKNTVVQETGESITLERGAGPSTELVGVGEQGFDENGNTGTFNGSNGFKYKYQYKAIFIDVTVITNRNNNWTRKVGLIYYPQIGYYEANIKFSVPGDSLPLQLQALKGTVDDPPPTIPCLFDVESFYNDPVHYDILRNHNYSVSSALEIGSINYSSQTCPAVITLASNPAGTETNFAFKNVSSTASIPHKLVYCCTTGAEEDCIGPIVVSKNRKSFSTFYDPVGPPSPIEGTLGAGYYLEATLKLYVDDSLNYPSMGDYTSTIYVVLERGQ